MLAGVEVWGADRVFARIAAMAQEKPGGVVATDGDGTLWSGDVGEDLFHAFLANGRVEAPALEAMRRDAREHTLSDAGSGPDIARRIYEAYAVGSFPEERMCELMTWCFAGWTRGEVRGFARSVVHRGGLASRLHGEVIDVLQRVRQAGIPVVLVSASPVDVVAEAALRVGFASNDVVAARPRFDSAERMLPDVERPIPYATGKVTRLRERIGRDRTLYAALGDNAFDLAMLANANVGVAVRPKPKLRERAHEVGGLVELSQ